MTRRPAIVFSLLLALIFLAFSLPPPDAMTESHDGLDSVTTYFLMIDQFDVGFFDMTKILPQFLGGVVPFNALAISDANLVYLIFCVLPPFEGFLAVSALFKIVAFVGMYLLLTTHLLPPSQRQRLIASATAFCFAVFPTTFVYLGTSLAVPLFVWGALNTVKGERHWRNWVAILIYPVVATLHLGGVFLYAAVGLTAIVLLARRHPSARYFAVQVAILALVSAIVERRLLYHWFLASYDYVSSRTFLYERVLSGEHSLTFARWFRETVDRLLFGAGTQFPDFHEPFPILIILGSVLGALVFRSVRTEANVATVKRLYWILAGIVAISALAVAEENYNLLAQIANFPFRLHRIELVNPMLWWIAFALGLHLLINQPVRWIRGAAGLLAVIVCLHTAIQFPGMKERVMDAAEIPRHQGLRQGILNPDPDPRPVWDEHGGNFSFAEYLELDAFDELEGDLARAMGEDKSAYFVISVHLRPTAASFNGYYSLDGVFADYELGAHAQFWEMFEGEAAKIGVTGHRLEFPVAPESRVDGRIDPDFDTCLFWSRGGRVVFSRSEFADPARLHLGLLGTYGRVRVYLVDNPPAC